MESLPRYWSEEPSNRPDRARIGGLHCSLCTGTIEKALGKHPGVEEVAVILRFRLYDLDGRPIAH